MRDVSFDLMKRSPQESDEFATQLPCHSCFVSQMDKVELQERLGTCPRLDLRQVQHHQFLIKIAILQLQRAPFQPIGFKTQ